MYSQVRLHFEQTQIKCVLLATGLGRVHGLVANIKISEALTTRQSMHHSNAASYVSFAVPTLLTKLKGMSGQKQTMAWLYKIRISESEWSHMSAIRGRGWWTIDENDPMHLTNLSLFIVCMHLDAHQQVSHTCQQTKLPSGRARGTHQQALEGRNTAGKSSS